MKHFTCPRCGYSELTELGDGYYKCRKCGYTGSLGLKKEIFKS